MKEMNTNSVTLYSLHPFYVCGLNSQTETEETLYEQDNFVFSVISGSLQYLQLKQLAAVQRRTTFYITIQGYSKKKSKHRVLNYSLKSFSPWLYLQHRLCNKCECECVLYKIFSEQCMATFMYHTWVIQKSVRGRKPSRAHMSFICLSLTVFVVIFHHIVNLFYTPTPRFLSTLLEYNYTLQ